MKKTILFDFDGTVADTVGPIVEILNGMAEDFNFPQIDSEILENFRGQENKEALREALRKGNIPKHKLPLIVKRVWSETHKQIASWHPIAGIENVLLALKEDGCQIGIVTTGSKANVIKFLDGNKMDHFDFIYAGKSFFGKAKVIKTLLKVHHLNPEEVFYVGDQTSDIEAARSVNITPIAVTWGFNSEKILQEHKPEVIIAKPEELMKFFQSL